MAPERDDRVFKQTHVLGAFIVPFLLVAFVLAIASFSHLDRFL